MACWKLWQMMYKPQAVYPGLYGFQGIQINWILWIRTTSILQRMVSLLRGRIIIRTAQNLTTQKISVQVFRINYLDSGQTSKVKGAVLHKTTLHSDTISLRVSRATLTSDKLATNLRIFTTHSGLIIATIDSQNSGRCTLNRVLLHQRRFKSDKTHRSGSQRIINSKLLVFSPYRVRICLPFHTSVCNKAHSILPPRDDFLSLGLQSFYWGFIT